MMENENKEKKVILTDEELKEVAGGVLPLNPLEQVKLNECLKLNKHEECFKIKFCIWKDGKCVLKK